MTHTKTAEPIEMPFWMMTRVGPRYHVLHGGPGPQMEKVVFLGGNVAVHCKSMSIDVRIRLSEVFM